MREYKYLGFDDSGGRLPAVNPHNLKIGDVYFYKGPSDRYAERQRVTGISECVAVTTDDGSLFLHRPGTLRLDLFGVLDATGYFHSFQSLFAPVPNSVEPLWVKVVAVPCPSKYPHINHFNTSIATHISVLINKKWDADMPLNIIKQKEKNMESFENPIQRRTFVNGFDIATLNEESLMSQITVIKNKIKKLESGDFESKRVDKFISQLEDAVRFLVKTLDEKGAGDE